MRRISIGYLDKQDDWLQTDMDMLKSLLDRDVKVKKMMQQAAAEEEERKQREAFAEAIGFDVDKLSGIEFENVCQVLVEKMGFTTQTTKASGDGGIDLIAYNHQPLLSGKYIIQCKRYAGSVGGPIIRDLYGVIMSERANKGILMTTGHFTKSAISFAEGKPIELIDGIKLKELLTQYQLVSTSNSTIDLVEFIEQLNDEDISLDDETDSLTVLNQFCGFSALNDMLLQNSHNYSVRARMIDLLMQAYLWDNRDYFVYDEVYYEKIPITVENYKRCLAQQLRDAIAWFYKFADEKDVCDTHFIRAVVLEEGTLQHMRLLFLCIANYEDEFRKAMGAKRIAEAKKELASKKRTLQKSENRLSELDRLFKRIYEDMVNGKLSEARFQMLSDDYEQEQEELRAKIEMLENEIQNLENHVESVDNFIRLAKKHLYIEKLTPEVLNDMVKAVYVHAPDKSSGHRVQDVDISYNHIGILPANLLYDIINGKAA